MDGKLPRWQSSLLSCMDRKVWGSCPLLSAQQLNMGVSYNGPLPLALTQQIGVRFPVRPPTLYTGNCKSAVMLSINRAAAMVPIARPVTDIATKWY